MEALELSERTVPGKGGKAGPQGRYNNLTIRLYFVRMINTLKMTSSLCIIIHVTFYSLRF